MSRLRCHETSFVGGQVKLKIKLNMEYTPKEKLQMIKTLANDLVEVGADYSHFQSAQIVHKNVKKVAKLLNGLK